MDDYCKIEAPSEIEIWNVGKLGGQAYEEAIWTITLKGFNAASCEVTSSEQATGVGVFSGGPNGTMSIAGADIVLLKGATANVTLAHPLMKISVYCNHQVLNPDAFDGWQGP